MSGVLAPLLGLVGVGLLLAGLAHAWLPRALGWTPQTHQDAGPLSALVVRMHVYFLGFFLVAFGILAIVVASAPPSTVGRTFCGLAAAIFAVRAVVEIRWVGPVVATGPRPVAVLHTFALVVWPALVAVFAGSAVFGAA